MRGVSKRQMIYEISNWIEFANIEGVDNEINKTLNRLPENAIRSILDTMVFLEQTNA